LIIVGAVREQSVVFLVMTYLVGEY